MEQYNAELQEEMRIQKTKKDIMKNEWVRLRKLKEEYQKAEEFDGTKGMCCLTFENETGGKIIQYLDALGILTLNVRSFFAIWSLVNDERIEIYSRVRLVTFWIQWVCLFIVVVGFAFYNVIINEEGDNQLFLLLSLGELFVLLMCSLLDYHYCKVIKSFSKGTLQRKKDREKAERKAARAEERQRRKLKDSLPPKGNDNSD